MSYRIVLTERARTDLREITQYIAGDLQSPQNAQAQLSRLEKAILSLDELPERFRIYDQAKWRERNLRIMPVDNYLVFYIPAKEEETVTVLRVMYGGRDVSRQLGQL